MLALTAVRCRLLHPLPRRLRLLLMLMRGAAAAAPWLTKLANAVITGRLVERQRELARDAVDNLVRRSSSSS